MKKKCIHSFGRVVDYFRGAVRPHLRNDLCCKLSSSTSGPEHRQQGRGQGTQASSLSIDAHCSLARRRVCRRLRRTPSFNRFLSPAKAWAFTFACCALAGASIGAVIAFVIANNASPVQNDDGFYEFDERGRTKRFAAAGVKRTTVPIPMGITSRSGPPSPEDDRIESKRRAAAHRNIGARRQQERHNGCKRNE